MSLNYTPRQPGEPLPAQLNSDVQNSTVKAAPQPTSISQNAAVQNSTAKAAPQPTSTSQNAAVHGAPNKEPQFIYVGSTPQEELSYSPEIDVGSKDCILKETVFKIPQKTSNNEIETQHKMPTASNLVDAFFSHEFITNFTNSSNAYMFARKMKAPNLQCWKRKSSSREFGVGCMYHFLAVIYYFGIVRLPGKRDYWSNCKWMPAHPICNMLSMSRDRFEVIWRNFHFNVGYNEDDFVSTPEEEKRRRRVSGFVNGEDCPRPRAK